MTYEVRYAKKALEQLKNLDKATARRIVDKVDFYARQVNPLAYAQKLKHPAFGEYRFRIGDWRVIFDVDRQDRIVILLVLIVKHRKDVYRGL